MNSSPEGKKIGLALGSGAARGLAHIGVLTSLQKRQVRLDYLSGSSIGALVGACFAKEGDIEPVKKLVLDTDWRRLVDLVDLNLAFLLKGFVQGEKVKELLRALLGDVHFKDLKIPLSVVATDIKNGEAVVINKGSVLDAVRASISMPALFMPCKRNGSFLIDGGIVSPLPVTEVRDMGSEFIIASNVIQSLRNKRAFSDRDEKTSSGNEDKDSLLDRKIVSLVQSNELFNRKIGSYMRKIKKNMPAVVNMFDSEMREAPNIFEVIAQALYSMEYQVLKSKKEEADLVITSNTDDIASLEFFRAGEAIDIGYRESEKVLNDEDVF